MKIIYLKFLLPIFVLCATVKGQKTDSSVVHHISLSFGINQIADENLHPKVSTGTITQLNYGFEKKKNTWKQFDFTLGYSRLKTKLEDLSKSINLKLNLHYSHTFHAVHKGNFNYYIGPELRLAYSASYLPNWDDSHLYWANYLAIGVSNNVAFRFKNKCEWVNAASFPLFSVFSRPELYRLYKIDNTSFGGITRSLNSNITAAHIINVFYIRFQSEYRFPVFTNKKEAFTFSAEWLRVKHNDGYPFRQLCYQVGLKLFL